MEEVYGSDRELLSLWTQALEEPLDAARDDAPPEASPPSSSQEASEQAVGAAIVVAVQSPTAPLSDDELDDLSDRLDEHSPFDIDSLLGFFHALAVAPGLVPTSTWLAAVLEPPAEGFEPKQLQADLDLVIRLYNQVIAAVTEGAAVMPEEDDEEGCAIFAEGFLEGAALDPEWGDADAGVLAAFAYLADELDGLPHATIARLEKELAPDPKRLIREQMAALVTAAWEHFAERRRKLALAAMPASPGPARARKVGRNDPCPCGSGKKYKRCCAP